MGLIPVSLTTLDKKTVKILRKEIEIYDKKLKDPNLKGSESAFLRNQRNKNKAQINKTLGLYDKHFNGKFKDELDGMTNSVMSVQKIYERIGGTAFTVSYDTTGWAPEFLQNFLARPGENTLVAGGTALALSCFMKTQLGEGAKGLLAEGMKAIFTTPLEGEALAAAMEAGQATFALNWAAIGIAAGALALIGGLAYRNYRRKKEMTAAIAREAEEAAYEGTVRDENALNAARTDKEKFEALVQEAADDPEAFQHLQMVVRNSPGTVYAKMAQRILVAAQNAKNKEDFSLAAQTVQGKLEGTPEAMQYLDERDAIANIEDLFKKQKEAKSRLTATPVVVTVQQKIDKVFTMSAADLVSAYGSMSENQFKAEITNGLPAGIAESVEFKTQVANAWEKVTKAKSYSELSETSHLESVLMGKEFDASPEKTVLEFIEGSAGTGITGDNFIKTYPSPDAFVLACIAEYSGPKLPTEIENYARSAYESMKYKKVEEEKSAAIKDPTITTPSAAAASAINIIKKLKTADSSIVKKTLAAYPTEADFVAAVTKGVSVATEKTAIETYAKQVYAYLTAKKEYESSEPKFTAYGLTDEAKAKKVDVDKLLTYTGAQLETILTKYKDESAFVAAFKLPVGNASASAFEEYLKNVYKALTSKREFEAAGPAKRTTYDLDHTTITAEVKKPEETIKNFPTIESYVERFPDNMKPFARAAYESMEATVAYKSAVAENNATVTSGKVTHINGHAENANRSAFYNIFQPLVDAGTSFRDETGSELFIDLKNAIAAGKSTKEIAQILKSKYGIDLEKMREAAKGSAEKATEKKETEAEAEAEA